MWGHSPAFDKLRERLRVLILGSYDDDKIKFLTGLRDRLVGMGFENCKLVDDFGADSGMSSEPYGKSSHWISRADVCILVFFEKGYNEGLMLELSFISEVGLLRKCVLTYQKSLLEGRKVTSLFPGYIFEHSNKVHVIGYDDMDKLVEQVSGQLYNSIHTIAIELESRKREDWELNLK